MSQSFEQSRLEMLLPRRRDLPQRVVGQEVLVRDPDSGQVHFLNATAALIWEHCDGVTPLEECVRLLRAAFAVPEAIDLQADVRETLRDFAQRGILDVPAGSA